jgi:hypothetical protein
MLVIGKLLTGVTAGQRADRPTAGLSLMLVLAGIAIIESAVPSITSAATTADA